MEVGFCSPTIVDDRTWRWPAWRSAAARTITLLTLAQLVASFLSRFIINDRLDLMPPGLWALRPFISSTRQDVVVITAAAVLAWLACAALSGTSWRAVPLKALAVFAWLHCFLLGINIFAVEWTGAPLTLQWLYFADLLQSSTPRAALAAIATPVAISILLLVTFAPWWTGLLFRRLVPSHYTRRLEIASLTTVLFCTLTAASVPIRPLPKTDFVDSWHNPMVALSTSLFGSVPHLDLPASAAIDPDPYIPARQVLRLVPADSRPDIVLIVLESVGASTVEDNRDRTPNIRALARSGVFFPNAYAATASTPRSLFSLMLSRDPLVGMAPEIDSIDTSGIISLPQRLRQLGYRTAFFGADTAYRYESFFLARHGFEVHDAGKAACPGNAPSASDACIFTEAAGWATGAPQPFFLTIWSNDTHFPYAGLPAGSLGAYRQSLTNLDAAVGRLVARLDRAGRLDNTVFVLVGDHGEAFGEHGRKTHSTTIFDEEVRVPLLVSGRRIESRGTVDPRLARLTDIAPTILELAGSRSPPAWAGNSLLSGHAPGRLFLFAAYRGVELGIREGSSKLVLDYSDGRFTKYALDRDPRERSPNPLTNAERARAETLLAAWMQQERQRYAR